MPGPRRGPAAADTAGAGAAAAAAALVGVAPLLSRWIERLLANHQPRLTLTQLLTLRAVSAGVDSGAELARSAGVSAPAVSQLIAGLADAGLLQRGATAADRRRSALALTPAGRVLLDSVQELLRTSLAGALADLPGPELDALARALPHLEAILSGVTPPRRPAPPRPGPPGPPGRPPGAERRP